MNNTKKCQVGFVLEERHAITGPWGPENTHKRLDVGCKEALRVFRRCIFSNEERADGSFGDLLGKPIIIISDFRVRASSITKEELEIRYLGEVDIKDCKSAVESALSHIEDKENKDTL